MYARRPFTTNGPRYFWLMSAERRTNAFPSPRRRLREALRRSALRTHARKHTRRSRVALLARPGSAEKTPARWTCTDGPAAPPRYPTISRSRPFSRERERGALLGNISARCPRGVTRSSRTKTGTQESSKKRAETKRREREKQYFPRKRQVVRRPRLRDVDDSRMLRIFSVFIAIGVSCLFWFLNSIEERKKTAFPFVFKTLLTTGASLFAYLDG